MKKIFFLTAAAATLFAACQKTEVVYNKGPQEIAMFAVNNVATKAPVTDAIFPATDKMQVVAYLADGGTADNYFAKTPFAKGAGSTWVGNPARYWPVTDATLNFLAVSEPNANTIVTTTFAEGNYASGATVALADNSSTQYDLMYAFGQGQKTSSTPAAVDMAFKHALSLIAFKVSAAGDATIQVKSITLNDANYSGTLTLSNSSYNSKVAVSTANVTPAWSNFGTKTNKSAFSGAQTCTATATSCGEAILVVPNTAKENAGFTVSYTIDGGAAVNYTANFAAPETWEAGKKYTYVIAFGEAAQIEIAPTVDLYITDLDGDGEADDDITVNVQ